MDYSNLLGNAPTAKHYPLRHNSVTAFRIAAPPYAQAFAGSAAKIASEIPARVSFCPITFDATTSPSGIIADTIKAHRHGRHGRKNDSTIANTDTISAVKSRSSTRTLTYPVTAPSSTATT